MKNAQHKQPEPDWAPDGCPADVVSLVADDQFLQDLGVRGLMSADSKETHQAVRKLKWHLSKYYAMGQWRGQWIGGAIGYLVGILCGYLVAWVFAG